MSEEGTEKRQKVRQTEQELIDNSQRVSELQREEAEA